MNGFDGLWCISVYCWAFFLFSFFLQKNLSYCLADHNFGVFLLYFQYIFEVFMESFLGYFGIVLGCF